MDNKHKDPIFTLLYNQLKERGYLFGSFGNNTETIIMDLEEITDQILKFFTEADSYDKAWVLNEPSDLIAQIDWMPKTIFRRSYDEKETKASKRAEQGDFFPIARIIKERGYLRTSDARDVVARKLKIKGKDKPGSPKTEINEQRFKEVGFIQVREKCSWPKAKEIWLDEQKNEITLDTLNSSITRLKKDDPEFADLLSKLFEIGAKRT